MTLPQNQHDAAKFDRLEKGKKLKEKNISGKCTQHTHTRGEGEQKEVCGGGTDGRQSCQVCCLLSASIFRLEIN